MESSHKASALERTVFLPRITQTQFLTRPYLHEPSAVNQGAEELESLQPGLLGFGFCGNTCGGVN